jgi:hypothetical protein
LFIFLPSQANQQKKNNIFPLPPSKIDLFPLQMNDANIIINKENNYQIKEDKKNIKYYKILPIPRSFFAQKMESG